MLKRFSIALALAAALCLAFAGTAFANFGPHGGYVDDTDACAGCHRAHTSFSTLGWTDKGGTYGGNALLVGGYTNTTEFCNACHGDLAPGASTNVVSGVFDSGPSGSSTQAVGVLGQANGVTDGGSRVVVAYSTDSTFNAPLNGGGFSDMPDPYVWEASATVAYKNATSAHSMEAVGPLWGAGSSVAGNTTLLTCTSCHDPHGTSNYRLLKGSVNGNTVGGYQADGETPNPFVFSNESGYPLPVAFGGNTATGGWLKHEMGASQMASYTPDYTTPRYASLDPTGGKSMSVWCSGCHEEYNKMSSAYDYGAYEGGGAVGSQTRHRHPIDVSVTAGKPVVGQSLNEAIRFDQSWVPLEEKLGGSGDPYQNVIGCLTCHRAHGSSVDMTGWASAHLVQNGAGQWVPSRDATPGVDPDKLDGVAGVPGGTVPVGSSALLRADNRGVCERCHNK